MEESLGDVKVIHMAAAPTPEGDQYCLFCAKLLCVSSKSYVAGEEVFEERSTKNRTLAKRGYIRCTEIL